MSEATPKLLAEGTLPVTRAFLYMCPARTRALLKLLTLVNSSPSDVTLNLYVNAGNPRRIVSRDMTLKTRQYARETGEFALTAGQSIDGDAALAGSIEYTISGIEYQ